MKFAEIIDRLISLVFPPRCLVCNDVVEYDDFLCEACEQSEPPKFIRPSKVESEGAYSGVYAAEEYSGDIRKLIFRMKENRNDSRVFSFFAAEMYRALTEHFDGNSLDVIVPVPITDLKWETKGWNQAEILAQYLSRYINVEVKPDVLLRREDTKVQRGLSAAERRVNAEKSYETYLPEGIEGKTVLLVDDVFTTGATADACAKKMLEAGAAEVHVVTAASTTLRSDNDVDVNPYLI